MKKFALTIVVSLFAQNLLAYQALNLSEYREALDEKIKQVASECAYQADQIKQGIVYDILKEQNNLDDQKARTCNREYSKLMKRFCQKKIEVLSMMKNSASAEKIEEISKGFSSRPESTAVGAVILYKTKKELQRVQNQIVYSTDRYVNQSKCGPLKEDKKLKQYLSDYFVEQYDLISQTTLRAE